MEGEPGEEAAGDGSAATTWKAEGVAVNIFLFTQLSAAAGINGQAGSTISIRNLLRARGKRPEVSVLSFGPSSQPVDFANEKFSVVSQPPVVGNAALLLPRLYTSKRCLKRRSLRVIPHCYEWDEPFFVAAREWEDSRVIDITGGIEEVIEEIVSCDRIISSSLHGIICADAYGVPALWLHASDKPVGDGFKFRDYFTSVDRPDREPIPVDASTARNSLEDRFFDYKIGIDLDALWRACPVDAGSNAGPASGAMPKQAS